MAEGGLPALERKLINLIEADVHGRGAPEYRASKALRDALTSVMVEVFLAGTEAGPIPGMANRSYAAQTGQEEPREGQ